MHTIACVKWLCPWTIADEGRPIASRVARCSHSQTRAQPRQPVGSRSHLGSESLPALGHDADQRVLPILRQKTVGSLPCRRLAVTGLKPESLDLQQGWQCRCPPSERASYFACLMSVRFRVHSTGRTRTLRVRRSGPPQRPSELDRETKRQWCRELAHE